MGIVTESTKSLKVCLSTSSKLGMTCQNQSNDVPPARPEASQPKEAIVSCRFTETARIKAVKRANRTLHVVRRAILSATIIEQRER